MSSGDVAQKLVGTEYQGKTIQAIRHLEEYSGVELDLGERRKIIGYAEMLRLLRKIGVDI